MITFEGAARRICGIFMILGGVCLVALMLHIVANVASNALFNKPIIGTLEIVSWYYMVGIAFFPVAYVQYRRRHLMVEMFTLGLGPQGKSVVDALMGVASLVYVALLTWLVFGEAVEQTQLREFQDVTYFDMPVWPARWFLVVSFAAMTVTLVLQVLIDLRYGFFGIGKPSTDRREQNLPSTS